jgi:hypothetical protein
LLERKCDQSLLLSRWRLGLIFGLLRLQTSTHSLELSRIATAFHR